MEWLNYHHLLYFSVAAREGTIAKASAELHLSQSAVSSQIRRLEEVLGDKLFVRSGRALELTETGQLVLSYANVIFSMGRELMDRLEHRDQAQPLRAHVGVADAVPKPLAWRLLSTLQQANLPIRWVYREDTAVSGFLSGTTTHGLDLVIADRPGKSTAKLPIENRLVLSCDTTLLGTRALCKRLRPRFPDSLEGCPIILPGQLATVRQELDDWLDVHQLNPDVVAECEDHGLACCLARHGEGVCVAPSAVADELATMHALEVAGTLGEVRQQFFIVVPERHAQNPVLTALFGATLKAKER